ncbi:hypothetical protein, partial [Streptomyces lunaelactis]|uniref:hypothetical protein n=1 Tax=Streptomyces lunaelactis TaxID=1535768 RepID=UPI001C30CA6F
CGVVEEEAGKRDRRQASGIGEGYKRTRSAERRGSSPRRGGVFVLKQKTAEERGVRRGGSERGRRERGGRRGRGKEKRRRRRGGGGGRR